MLILRLALRALRWRAATAATVFAVALVAILAATVGPVYLHSVDETVLAAHLDRASPFRRDVLVSRGTLAGFGDVDWRGQVERIADGLAEHDWFARPVEVEQTQVDLGVTGTRQELATIGSLCAHVRLVAGRCPAATSTTDVLLSAAMASAHHLGVGDRLAASAVTNGRAVALRVAGVYRPVSPDGSFWRPWSFFDFRQAPPANGPPTGDALLAAPAVLTSRLRTVPQDVEANVALRPSRVGYDDLGRVQEALGTANAAAAGFALRSGGTGVPAATVASTLSGILHAAERETALARTLVTVATVQLALLAVLVLYSVVANSTTVQGPEIALAKLRGRRTASVVAQSVAQPVLLVLLAAPVAGALAWLLVRLVAGPLLGSGVQVGFPAPAYAVDAVAAAGAVLAAVVATRRIVVTPVGALLRRGAAAPGSRVGLLIADAAAVTLAVAGLIELEVGGVLDGATPNPLAVLAPTLVAVAGSIVVLRLLPFAGRRLAGWTRDSRRLATFLAVRQLLRRPGEARALLLVAVAIAIAAFAVTNWTDAGHNRELRALNAAGADTVLVVRPGAGVDDLRTAVDRADPSGQAMAVAYTNADALPPLIAVDTSRFAAVGSWVAGNAPVDLASALRRVDAPRPAAVAVTGTRLRLSVDLVQHPRQAVRLAVSLGEPDRSVAVRTVRAVRPGPSSTVLRLPAACAQGCRVVGLGLSANTPDNPYATSSDVSRIAADLAAATPSGGRWAPVDGFADARRWRGDGTGPVSIHSSGSALAVAVGQSSGESPWPSLVSAATPTELPAVVASGTAARLTGDQIHHVPAVGLDGQSVTVDGVVRSLTLPRVDRNGALVSFGTGLAAMTGPSASSTQYQVWLSSSAPPDIVARLRRQHVTVLRAIHASAYRAELDDSGPAYADSLFLVAALAATVLAIGATAAGRVVSTRRRAYELAALEAIGVPSRALRRATAAEQGSVLVLGLLVGLAAGLVGSRLALPSTPVFVSTSTGPPLVVGLPWGRLAALTGGLVVVFLAVSALIGRLVERAATPAQLRGAQQ